MVSIVIGQPFPDARYISNFDRIVPRVNEHAFDIIITLNDITTLERWAIAEEQFEVFIFFFANIPHVVLRFADGNVFDFTINIRMVHSIPMGDWLRDKSETITIYLIEPGTGNVMNVRFFDFKNMTIFRNLLTFQFDVPAEEVPNLIRAGEQMFPLQAMIAQAQYKEVIPRVEIIL